MDAFALKYGNRSITLAQSRQLIGVKAKRDGADHAQEAVQRALPAKSWKAAGTLGGFQLVSICDDSVDAEQALDKIRRDQSVQAATHVFELPERRGIFVPTGELFVEFKPGTCAELKQKILDEFGLSIRKTQGAQGYLLVVTSRSPNPIRVVCDLQRKRCVSVAEPDLASNAVTKVLRLADDGLPAESLRVRYAGFQKPAKAGGMSGASVSDFSSVRAPALPQEAMSFLWHFGVVRQVPDVNLVPRSKPASQCDVFARAVLRRQARRGERACRSGMVAASAIVTAPTGAQAPSAPTARTIEIVVGAVTIRVPAGADVLTLRAVLHAVQTM